jgi:hypothetical protein
VTRTQDVLARRLRTQARACAQLGSPLYAELMVRAAADVEARGPVLDVLAGHENDPGEHAIALRLFGGLHRLALEGGAPGVAAHLPSTGGDADADAAWPAVLAAVRDEAPRLRAGLRSPPQTNEVGRSAALLVGYHTVAAETARPLRLLEVGASAGLNLRWDRYRYDVDATSVGDLRSPVRFPSSWFEGAWSLPRTVAVAERRGCDAAPIDPAREDDRLRLLSYVWPDQRARFERLAGALEVAARLPVVLDAADACDWIETRLSEPADGVATVVFHSIFVQYLTVEGRARLLATIEEAGRRAGHAAPLAWLRMEPGGDRQTEVRLTLWPGGHERVLATAGFHGQPVRWLS